MDDSLVELIAGVIKKHSFMGYGACRCGWQQPDIFTGPTHQRHVAERIEREVTDYVSAVHGLNMRGRLFQND